MLFLLFNFWATLIGIVPHDLHLSKTEIVYNDRTDAIEVVMHVFIDDLELGMGDMAEGLYLGTDREREHADSLMSLYLKEHFILSSGADTLQWHFLGKEVSDDLMAFWCYMEVERPQMNDELTVYMSLFDKLYDDQKNVVDIRYDADHRKYALLRKGSNSASVKLP